MSVALIFCPPIICAPKTNYNLFRSESLLLLIREKTYRRPTIPLGKSQAEYILCSFGLWPEVLDCFVPIIGRSEPPCTCLKTRLHFCSLYPDEGETDFQPAPSQASTDILPGVVSGTLGIGHCRLMAPSRAFSSWSSTMPVLPPPIRHK